MSIKVALFFFFVFIVSASAQRHHVITTKSGQVRGRLEFSSLLRSFYAFKGIPYAEPPIGDLRFRNPVPHPGWEGIRDATAHGSSCPCSIIGMRSDEEDCLFLNVYAKQLNKTLPVMFWIHGGAFLLGDGNSMIYGPNLLVQEDVCVVTINYRLSSFGFLSTGDLNAQGNYGLKDIVLALRWVNENIGAFGCNPQNITIFGQSAGAVSVNLMMISEMAKGLFQQAIMQSGSAVAPFVLQTNPREYANKLAQKLRIDFKSTEDLISRLRGVSVDDILAAERSIFDMDQPLGLRPFDYVVVVEPEDSNEERFLIDTPMNLMASGNFEKVPLMIGTTDNEGLLMIRPTQLDPETFKRYNEDENFLVPLSFNLSKSSSETGEVAGKFREIYFHGRNLSDEMLAEWAIFHTDAQFIFPTDRVITAFSQNSSNAIFRYTFSYSGEFNFLKRFLFLNSFQGACHFDEIFYLFSPGFPLVIPVWPGDHALTVRRRMVQMWTNFAKFGHPTPTTNSLIRETWPPYNLNDQYYLDIGHSLTVKSYLENPKLNTWRDFQKRFTGRF